MCEYVFHSHTNRPWYVRKRHCADHRGVDYFCHGYKVLITMLLLKKSKVHCRDWD